MQFRGLKALVLSALLGLTGVTHATALTLTSEDGRLKIDGELLSFDGENYVVRTGIGDVVVNAARVTCVSSDCPVLEALPITFTGVEELADSLLPALLEGYSFELDADMLLTASIAKGNEVILTKQDGERLAEITLVNQNTAESINALANGNASFALVTRRISEKEAQVVAASGQGDLRGPKNESVVALDGIVVVTHRDNPIGALSQSEISDIFTGKITNWLELGGSDAAINLYVRGPQTGTGASFANLMMTGGAKNFAPKSKIMESDASLSDAVASDFSGIGFTRYSAERNARAVAVRGSCGILTAANAFTIKTEEYPYSQRIYAYLPENRLSSSVREFQEYLETDAAQAVIADMGYVDQAFSEIPINAQGMRFATAVLSSETTKEGAIALKNMISELVAAERLSLTLRYKNGSSEPDDRAESDMMRLANLVTKGRFQNKEIVFVGFSDSYGDNASNLALSKKRADAAEEKFAALLGPEVAKFVKSDALGFGELSPLGCDDTQAGREINRRVEVWVRDISHNADFIFRAN